MESSSQQLGAVWFSFFSFSLYWYVFQDMPQMNASQSKWVRHHFRLSLLSCAECVIRGTPVTDSLLLASGDIPLFKLMDFTVPGYGQAVPQPPFFLNYCHRFTLWFIVCIKSLCWARAELHWISLSVADGMVPPAGKPDVCCCNSIEQEHRLWSTSFGASVVWIKYGEVGYLSHWMRMETSSLSNWYILCVICWQRTPGL